MALIHPASCPSTKSELDILSLPPTQVAIEKGTYVKYHPVSSIASSPSPTIQFELPADSATYIDINENNLYLELKFQPWKGTTATPWTSGDVIVFSGENGLFSAIISHCDLMVCDQLVSKSTQNNAYVSYIENLLGIPHDAKKTILIGWHPEFVGRDLDAPSDERSKFTQDHCVAGQD